MTSVSLHEQVPPPQAPQQGYPAAPPPPPRKTSGLAITGLILAFILPPIGFILSLVAIVKTGAAKAKGRGLAITGIIVSTVLIAGYIGAGIWVSQWRVLDPGCTAGKTAILEAPDTSTDPSALQTIIEELRSAETKAKHDDVRAAIKALADDFTELQAAIKSGEVPPGIMEKVGVDAEKIDTLCTI